MQKIATKLSQDLNFDPDLDPNPNQDVLDPSHLNTFNYLTLHANINICHAFGFLVYRQKKSTLGSIFLQKNRPQS